MPAEILLIQPPMGILGEFSRHLPLSLLYVASALKGLPVKIKIIDNRILKESWKEHLASQLNENTILAGLTVMSGTPVRNAIEVSRFVKENSRAKIVWGGSLTTLVPDSALREDYIDFTVSGSGISAIKMLVQALMHNDDTLLCEVPGLGYKSSGKLFFNKPFCGFEPVDYRDIPYDLIGDYSVYGQIGTTNLVFPIYGAHGCPYQCAFCISPGMYRNFPKKWVPLNPSDVVEHIEFLVKKYSAGEIYFYDDDSFVDIEHIRTIIRGVRQRDIHVRLSFRGARVNEVLKMDSAFLNELADAGTHILHIGIESGSQRVLDLYNKNVTISDILAINRKLAENDRLIAGFNWIVGAPSETQEEIMQTVKLLRRLISENPRCIVFPPNPFRPIPGSVLASKAKEYGYVEPYTLEQWINEELEAHDKHPWYTESMTELIRMLRVTSYFIDRKEDLILETHGLKSMLIRILMKLYRPFARFRFRTGFYRFLVEDYLYRWFIRVLGS